METNEVMNLNNIIYRIYDTDDLEVLKDQVLHEIRMLIPCSYASILVSNPEQTWPMLVAPYCVPEQFREAEEKYIELEDIDHLLWTIHSDQPIVIRESQIMSDEKRLQSPIYQECYQEFDIYDTLQLSLVHNKIFMGVLTLYRTTKEGVFSEQDAFYLQMLSSHLSKKFYEGSVDGQNREKREQSLDRLREKYSLTKREIEILSLIFDNVTDDAIAEQFHISPHTLRKHVQNIYHKLGISARWELIKYKP